MTAPDLIEATNFAQKTRHYARADTMASQNGHGLYGFPLCSGNHTVSDQELADWQRKQWAHKPRPRIATLPLCKRCAKLSAQEPHS